MPPLRMGEEIDDEDTSQSSTTRGSTPECHDVVSPQDLACGSSPAPSHAPEIARPPKASKRQSALRSITPSTRHTTRQALHGRSDVNYNMKLHPEYDKIFRPGKWARLTGRAPDSPSDSSGSSSRKRARSESGSTASVATGDVTPDSSVVSSEDEDEDMEPPEFRAPDPKATRHSSRAAARKYFDFNRHHHPQDGRIPGTRSRRRVAPSPERKRRKAKRKVAAPAGPSTAVPSNGTPELDDVNQALLTELPRAIHEHEAGSDDDDDSAHDLAQLDALDGGSGIGFALDSQTLDGSYDRTGSEIQDSENEEAAMLNEEEEDGISDLLRLLDQPTSTPSPFCATSKDEVLAPALSLGIDEKCAELFSQATPNLKAQIIELLSHKVPPLSHTSPTTSTSMEAPSIGERHAIDLDCADQHVHLTDPQPKVSTTSWSFRPAQASGSALPASTQPPTSQGMSNYILAPAVSQRSQHSTSAGSSAHVVIEWRGDCEDNDERAPTWTPVSSVMGTSRSSASIDSSPLRAEAGGD